MRAKIFGHHFMLKPGLITVLPYGYHIDQAQTSIRLYSCCGLLTKYWFIPDADLLPAYPDCRPDRPIKIQASVFRENDVSLGNQMSGSSVWIGHAVNDCKQSAGYRVVLSQLPGYYISLVRSVKKRSSFRNERTKVSSSGGVLPKEDTFG